MEQQLTIGVLDLSLSWQTVLNQIGVSYSEIAPSDNLPSCQYSLIIINKPVTKSDFENIRDYVKKGGACIDEGFCIDMLTKGTLGTTSKRYIFADNLPFKPSLGIIDLYAKVRTFSKAQYLDKTLYVDNYGDGLISFLGLDINTLLFDSRSKQKEFYSRTPRFPNEEVARVSKGEITRLIFFLFRHLHISRGLLFAHKWFFPQKAKNIFLFRIDSDYGSKEQVKKWYDIAREHGIRYTWFLHVAAHEEWLNTFAEFKDHETAVHCYNHTATKKYNALTRDIERAKSLLSNNRLSCSGYSSPYGLWNKEMNTVCELYGFTYSSEFSYIYDSFPLYPVLNNKKSSVLQIPIHPICIGNLVNAKANEDTILDYFTGVFQNGMMIHNPLIFYDHLLHDYSNILREMFTYVKSLSVPMLTFTEYAKWWIDREHIQFITSVKSVDSVKISASTDDRNCFLCIWTDNDTYILTSRSGNINPLTCQKNIAQYQSNVDGKEQLKTRTFHLRLHKQSLLNRLLWRKYR